MIRKIHLHGHLQKLAPEPIELDVDSPMMMFRGLETVIPGFRDEVRKVNEYTFIRIDSDGNPIPINIANFDLLFGDSEVVHLVPNVDGNGFEVAVYLGFAVGTIGYYVVGFAVNMLISLALNSIASKFAGSQQTSGIGGGSAEAKPSFLFNGPVNTAQPGYPVPLLYGEFRAGSVVISVGAATEEYSG